MKEVGLNMLSQHNFLHPSSVSFLWLWFTIGLALISVTAWARYRANLIFTVSERGKDHSFIPAQASQQGPVGGLKGVWSKVRANNYFWFLLPLWKMPFLNNFEDWNRQDGSTRPKHKVSSGRMSHHHQREQLSKYNINIDITKNI